MPHLHDQVDALSQGEGLSTTQAQRAVVIQHRVQGLYPHMVNRPIQNLCTRGIKALLL